MRCLAFAETLAWAGWRTTFATRSESLEAMPSLAASGHNIVRLDGRDPLTLSDDVGVSLVDHYGLDAAFERTLTGRDRTMVVFDDLADRSHVADILVDPTPGRRPTDYQDRVQTKTRLLLGPRHAIVRREWRVKRAQTRARLERGGQVERILVSMGATDPHDTTSRILAAIAPSSLRARVDVVLTSVAPHLERVATLVGPHVKLHVDPADFAGLVAGTDLAIGAPGSSSFERATLGLPAILIPTADNQRHMAAGFAKAGAAEVLPESMLGEPAALGARIASLANDAVRRVAMSRAAAALTDGRGALRLLTAIAGHELAADGSAFSVRLAEGSDSDWLLDLQRKPETRKFSVHPAVPTGEEHQSWFAATLGNPDRLLMIVEANGNPVGMLRLDRTPALPPTFELSIAIDPSWHRRGVGRAALALARRLAPGADILATVLRDNQASVALFKAAGYRPEGPERMRSRAA